MEIIVLAVFHTSLGLIAVLKFPKSVFPKVNMRLIKDDVIYLIKGIQFESPRPFEDLEGREFSCLLSENAYDISVGDEFRIHGEE